MRLNRVCRCLSVVVVLGLGRLAVAVPPQQPGSIVLDDMFVPLQAARHRKRIVLAEAAEAYDFVYADEQELGRKVRTLAGNFQLVSRHPALLAPWRNPIALQFASHKLMRLLTRDANDFAPYS